MSSEETVFDESDDLREGNKLRPHQIRDFIGQRKKVENLITYIKGAQHRREALDHVLLYGPPGLGKTTLAQIASNEMGANFRQTSGPVLEKKGDLTAILTDLEEGDVLFIDEIHRLRTSIEEILYKAMEDFSLDIIIGQGVGARNISIDINRFTLIGATTRAGLLSSPLRDRFGIMVHLDFYSISELKEVVKRSSSILEVPLTDSAAMEIARRSRGTPRIANKLLRRIRDFAQVEGDGRIDDPITKRAFEAIDVDSQGFDDTDRRILLTIMEKFQGGPVGLTTLATAIQEEKDTLEDVYEPYLVQQGFLMITNRGRVVTDKSYLHFGIKKNMQKGLFK